MKILVTGAAGFIGAAVCGRLLERGDEVVGLDNLNAYYDPRLKRARLSRLSVYSRFRFLRQDVADKSGLAAAFETFGPRRVIHQAAQAGVGYSLTDPHAYIGSNLEGFLNILEQCRRADVEHLVYASSSSVYGGNRALPLSAEAGVDHPLSFYAVTKRCNELMAHSYSHLFGIPTTGLRFFNVYGPWGRPDMALFLFTRAILEGKPIDVFNRGDHRRDFTYIDDVVEAVVRVLDNPARGDPGWNPECPSPSASDAPFRIYNVGNGTAVSLEELIGIIEEALGKKAVRRLLPLQPGSVIETCGDVSALERDFGFRPRTSIRDGVHRFIDWYKCFYRSAWGDGIADRATTLTP